MELSERVLMTVSSEVVTLATSIPSQLTDVSQVGLANSIFSAPLASDQRW